MQNEHLKRITEKIQTLARKQELLLKENARLRKETIELKDSNDAQATKISNLEQTIAVLKTLTGKINETDKKDLDKRLNQYLKEIDRCINMLST